MHGKGKSQGEKGAVVFEAIHEKDHEGGDKFSKYSASEINLIRLLLGDHRLTIKEIEERQLNQNQRGQLDGLVDFVQIALGQQRIDNFAEMLRSGVVRVLRDNSTVIFRYITQIYLRYAGTLENDIQNRNQKLESHGLFLGLLANFSHLYMIGIDLNLSLVNSYVAFLVHHQAEKENIPIVINIGWRTSLALERARGDAQRLHASSFISIHTESKHAVCVGLNFNSRLAPFRVGIAELQKNRFPLVQRLFECVEDEEIRENRIKDFLLQHLLAEITRNAGNRDRILDCIIGFAFGNSAFTREYLELRGGEDQVRLKKYIFRYNNEDLRRHALTMVFHTQGFPIVILDIRNPHDIRSVKAIALPPGYNGAVNRVTYILNDQYGLGVVLDRFNSPNHYLYRTRNASFDGDLIEVPNAENVHNTLNQVTNHGWQSIAQHRELLRAISRVLMPENVNGNAIIDVSNNDKFRSILHGIFYVCDNPDKVVTEYRVGQTYSPDIRMAGEVSTRVAEQRLGLLLLRSTINHTEDTHPIGYVLGFANTEQALVQERRNAEQQITRLMDKQRGYLPITPGNEVVLSYAVFNAGARRAEDLISLPQELYTHKFDRSHASGPGGRSGRIVRPVALNNILPQINTYIQNNPNGAFGQLGDVHDILTLDFATDNRNYHYWLQDEDVRYAARAQRYNLPHDEDNILFNVIREQDIHDQLQQLQDHINGREVQDDEILISNLIINIGRSHWVTLVIAYQNGNYYGYYTNSTGGNVPDWLNTLMVNDVPVPVHNVLADQEGNVLVQQRDGYNCGLWVLENTRSINQILQQNNNLGEQGRGVLDEMRNSLTLNVPGLNNIVDQDNLRNEQYFQNLRGEISREFRNTGTNVGHDRDNNPQIRGAIRLQNQNEIRELLLNFLELQYPTRGIWQQQPLGGGVPILSIGDSDNRELLKELEQPKNDKREARQEAEERKCEGIKQNKNLILNASDANKTVNDARLSGIKSFESQGVSTMLSDANVSGVSTRLGRY